MISRERWWENSIRKMLILREKALAGSPLMNCHARDSSVKSNVTKKSACLVMHSGVVSALLCLRFIKRCGGAIQRCATIWSHTSGVFSLNWSYRRFPRCALCTTYHHLAGLYIWPSRIFASDKFTRFRPAQEGNFLNHRDEWLSVK